MQVTIQQKNFTLSNSIPVYVVQRLGLPVFIQISIEGGNVFINDPTKKGLPHCVEHLLVSGSPSYPTKDLLVGYFDTYGVTVEGYTTRDTVSLRITIPDSADCNFILNEISAMLRDPNFQTTRLLHEKEIILNEISRSYSKPEMALTKAFFESVFNGTEYSADVLGNKENVLGFTENDVIEWNKEFVTSHNCSIVCVGNFNETELLTTLENNFGFIPKTNSQIVHPLLPSNYIPNSLVNIDFEQVQLMYGFRLPDTLTLKEKVGVYIMDSLLKKPRSGILSKIFREKLQLVYGITSRPYIGLYCAGYAISTATSRDQFDFLISELKEIIGNLGEYVTQEDFLLEQKRLKKIRCLSLQTSKEIAELILNAQKYQLTINEFWNILDTLTYEDCTNLCTMFAKAQWTVIKTN